MSGAGFRCDTVSNVPSGDANVPTLLRRRVSAIGQQALRAGFQIAASQPARFILCSRHGEFDRTVSLLRSIAAREPLSPADFSLSVHNALAGLLSIATKNTHGHTAIAAGPDSFGYGMLEAALCLATAQDEKVLVIYFDAPLPELYAAIDDDSAAPVALAVLMAPERGAQDDIVMSYASPEFGRGATAAVRSSQRRDSRLSARAAQRAAHSRPANDLEMGPCWLTRSIMAGA